jgi:hypothetical protein
MVERVGLRQATAVTTEGLKMKRQLAVLAVVLAAAFGGSAAATAEPVLAAPISAVKSCSSGWTHAVIGGEHKCLRAGQFCTRAYDRQYHRYGFHCHKYDARVDRYRLAR